MTTVVEALLKLGSDCDGAVSRDDVGFNGRDAPFAHSIIGSYRAYDRLTPKQERAIYKVMETYKHQLKENHGIDYDELEFQFQDDDDNSNGETRIWIGNTQYGEKIFVKFPYDKRMVRHIKEMDWDKSHRSFNRGESAWTFDINEYCVDWLQDLGFDIPSNIVQRVHDIRTQTYKVIVDSNRSKIKGNLPSPVNSALNNELAFRPSGYEYADSFRVGSWDGWIRLYKKWEQSFPTGLLDRVTGMLESYDIDYTVVDNRSVASYDVGYDWDGPDLRPYQERVVEDAISTEQGFIAMPTGAGKTLTALRVIYELDKKAVVFVHRKELLYQWVDRVINILGGDPGIVGDGHNDEGDITIAMLQTVHRNGLQNDYDIMICDEGHHIPADTFADVASKVDAKYRFSLSATAMREDNKEMLLWAHTGTIIADVTVEHLVEQGYLAKPKFVVIDPDVSFGGYKYQTIYKEMLKNHTRNQAIVDFAVDAHRSGMKVYIDVKRIKHGRKLVQMIEDKNEDAIFISGRSSTDKRQETLNTFETDGFILVSTLIKEGVDLPEMNMVILSGGGKSNVQVIQTIGRALRPKEGTNEAFVVDIHDRGKYVGDHYLARRQAMAEYYGDLYEPEEVDKGKWRIQ